MTGLRPQVVVTLPARSLDETQEELRAAQAAGADLAEIRLDRWGPSERPRLAELFPPPLPLIATLRSRREGGEGPDDPAEREGILREVVRFPFAYVDLEADRDRGLEGMVRAAGARVVRSSHLGLGGTAPELTSSFLEAPPEGIRKVVLLASFLSAVQDLLPRLERSGGPRPAMMTIGPSGPLFRAWARRLRMPLVYASLPELGGRPCGAPVEPSQIPVDRLRPFLEIEDGPIFALVGHPVEHSRSPAIHHRWMAREGRPGLYIALDLASPAEVRLAFDALPSRGVRGLNVTHPWKHLAYELGEERSADALASGTANCVRFDRSRVRVENTDVEAVHRRLLELRDERSWDGGALTVLGAGGAARATLAAAARLGARATVLARRAGSARALAEEFDAGAGDRRAPRTASLVVHATDVGRNGRGPLALPLPELVRQGTYVLDWVYSAEDPSVRQTAEAAGATYEDGARLLVYQAAASYRTWWGEAPGDAAIGEALREVSCAV